MSSNVKIAIIKAKLLKLQKYKDLNIKNVEELTVRVLLSGIGTQNFIGNISKTDLESLDDGKWVTDVISLVFKNIQRNVDGCNIALVEPSITQMLRKSADSDHVGGTMKDLKLNENDCVLPGKRQQQTGR